MFSVPMQPSSLIAKKLPLLPEQPGIYKYKDAQGTTLYIGKAKSLKQRVRSYFQPSANHNLRIGMMVSLANDVETTVTNTEAEALILEAQQIKQHQPRYNVALKDDKSYPYFKLTTEEKFPRLMLAREKFAKKTEYYGPYPSVRDARQVLQLINKFFMLRTSKMVLDGTKTFRPCINFQLKRCLAPCRGVVSVEQYGAEMRQVRLFLQGKYQQLLQQLALKMQEASGALEFEKAAKLRDQIQAVERIFQKQQFLSPANEDMDVFALYREANFVGIEVLFVRYGRLLATDFFYFSEAEEASNDNILGQVLNRIYMNESFVIPRKILLPFAYSDQKMLAETLSHKANHAVAISVPQRGHKKNALAMAQSNAEVHLLERKQQHFRNEEILQKVQQVLHLKKLPSVIEAFDISNISGSHTVASMVCWKNNQPDKKNYRKFKIKNVEGINDFASMQEVLTRRYQRSISGEQPLPDLILIDGGKGQLNQAVRVLADLKISLDAVDVIGLAKGRSEKRQKVSRLHEEDFEYVVKPNQKNEIRLHRHSSVLYLLQNIRDESHRFAITFHRSLRNKATLRSALDEIPGVGKARKNQLLKHFGSLKKIKQAPLQDLQAVPTLPESLAIRVYQHFHPVEKSV